MLEVSAAAGAGGLPSLGLLAPVVCFLLLALILHPHPKFPFQIVPRTLASAGRRVAAGGAGMLLHVERAATWIIVNFRSILFNCHSVSRLTYRIDGT